MITDSFFSQGFSHKICQDYAYNDKDSAVLSDGCSSGGLTHIGSAIIARSDNKLWKNIAGNLKLEYQDLTATKLYIDSNFFSLSGDGTIIYKYKGGSIVIMDVHFSENAPDYEVYMEYGLQQFYLDQFKNQTKTIDWYTSHIDSFPKTFMDTKIVKPFDYNETSYYSGEQFEWIMGFSDGLHSFVKDKEPMSKPKDIIELLGEFMDLKLLTPGVLQRRWNKIQHKLSKEGWSNYDDFSGVLVYND